MSKVFTIPVSETIPAGSSIQLIINEAGKLEPVTIGGKVLDADGILSAAPAMMRFKNETEKSLMEDEVLNNILNNGYVKNTKFHRRWVMAQYLRALQSPNGYYGYINNMSYMESFKKMIEEVRVLSKLEESGDTEAFNERKSFFSIEVVKRVIHDYMYEVEKYIDSLPTKHCKRKGYKTINGKGNMFAVDIAWKIYVPLDDVVFKIDHSTNYANLYKQLKEFQKLMVKLPDNTHKSKAWRDAYQASGAYYTLKNMIIYHNCILPIYENDTQYIGMLAVQELKKLLGTYKGFQYHALLKKTIEVNNFDYVSRMKELGVIK